MHGLTQKTIQGRWKGSIFFVDVFIEKEALNVASGGKVEDFLLLS